MVAQRDARQDSPTAADLYSIGTRATVHKVVKMPNQSLFVFTEGNERVKVGEFSQLTPFMTADSEVMPDVDPVASPEAEALQRNVVSQFQSIVTSSPTLSDDLQTIAINIDEPGRLSGLYRLLRCRSLTTTDKQELLETQDVTARTGAHQQAPGEGLLEVFSSCGTRFRQRCRIPGAAVAAGLLSLARAVEGDPEGARRIWTIARQKDIGRI